MKRLVKMKKIVTVKMSQMTIMILKKDESDEGPGEFNDRNAADDNFRSEPKFIVFLSQLLLLFQICPVCKTNGPLVTTHQVGTMVEVKTTCSNIACPASEGIWRSQHDISKIRTPAGNMLLSFAILVAGGSASKVFRVFRHMSLGCTSIRTFFKHQKEKIMPFILLLWKRHQSKLFGQLKENEEELIIGGDGRHDSMGHSAK
ncbi:uncharacterized protein LOC135683958 [Rhopilema esculentum]|uniref:uncharacterized protein LOC135683958 n=1 Tax=Rhopilema esculentum TaxID=499914 RepID=UPI0031D92E68